MRVTFNASLPRIRDKDTSRKRYETSGELSVSSGKQRWHSGTWTLFYRSRSFRSWPKKSLFFRLADVARIIRIRGTEKPLLAHG